MGTVDGVSKIYNDLAVLWIDAHCDLNLPATSVSGNIQGMPLSFVLNELQEYAEKFNEFSWVEPRIHAKNLAYIGLRDVDPPERYNPGAFGAYFKMVKKIQSDFRITGNVTCEAIKRGQYLIKI